MARYWMRTAVLALTVWGAFAQWACAPSVIGPMSSLALTSGSVPSASSVTTPYADGLGVGYSDQSSVSLAGTCADNALPVTVSISGGSSFSTTATCSGGTWSATVDLSSLTDGTVTITVTQSNAAGTSTPAVRTMTKATAYCAVPANRAAALATTGTGASAGTAYRICTYTQLTAVPGLSGAGVFFRLDDSIDRASAATPALGNFRGTLEGNGYTLKGFAMSTGGQGLFNTVNANSTIANLHLRGFTATGATGLLAATLQGPTTISGSSFEGSVAATLTAAAGGVAATSTAGLVTFSSVWSAATVQTGSGALGGFIASAADDYTFTNSRFTGTLTHTTAGITNRNSGGFVGDTSSTLVGTFTSSTSAGTLNTHGTAGGFVGYANGGNVTFTGCTHSGTITTYFQAGGFISDSGGSDVTITQSANTGSISATLSWSSTFDGVGGFIGINSANTLSISRSYNTGAISAEYNGAGGFIGASQGAGDITNSYSNAPITLTLAGGGAGTLIGADLNAPSTYNLTHVYGTGTLTSASTIGGLVGLLGGASSVVATAAFWDQTTTGTAVSGGGSGTPQSTALMQTQSTFAPPWDFSTIWILTGSGVYPTLR